MNILLGKIGQKVIFNRQSKDCDRSNTNGNVGTYLLMKLLIENNKRDTFYIASENDLSSFDKIPYDNVVDASNMTVDELSGKIKVMFVLTGLTQFEKSDRFINILNELDAKLILLSDDPRCLDSVEEDDRINRIPSKIISQFRGTYNFKGHDMFVEYEPIERASCYGQKFDVDFKEKTNNMVIVSNTSGKEYNRPKIVSDLICNTSGIDVYGRLTEEEQEMLGKSNYKGEIKYKDMQEVLRKSFSTLIVPIKKGWVTSKYVEALMNGVLPIFYCDYNVGLLEYESPLIVFNAREFDEVYKFIEYSAGRNDYIEFFVKAMYNEMIAPYLSGKRLSDILMSYAFSLVYKGRKIKSGQCFK